MSLRGRYGRQLFSNELVEVLKSPCFLQHVFANLREQSVLRQEIDVVLQLEWRRQRPVKRVDVGPPVADAVGVEVVDRLVVVIRPPRRVAEALVADHLQMRVDQYEVRVTLFDAIRLPQTVPRPVVVFEPFH